MRRMLVVLVVSLFAVTLVGCAGMPPLLDMNKYNAIEKTAVVVFTVPATIKYGDDKKKKKTFSLGTLADAVMQALSGPGARAATVSHEAFIETLNEQGLPFSVMSREEMTANEEFMALYVPAEAPVKEEKPVGLKLKSLQAKPEQGVAAEGLNQYGLKTERVFSIDEKQYLISAAKALGVDTLLVVVDPGYRFICKFCVGGSGSATTGSRFAVQIVDNNGEHIYTERAAFNGTEVSTPIVGGVVAPVKQDLLFKAHGERMAEEYAKALKKRVEITVNAQDKTAKK